MKNIKNFKTFMKEDATATMENTNGMGAVISSNPSSSPGDVADSSIGSGDIGQTLGAYTKKSTLDLKKRRKKKKRKENFNHEQNKPYDEIYVVKFGNY